MLEPQYGDDSSIYWSPGWNYQRYTSASVPELLALPEGELERMREGIRNRLGDEGFEHWTRHIEKIKEHSHRVDNTERAYEMTTYPGYVTSHARPTQDSEWGFVIYRLAAYGDAEKWSDYHRRWEIMCAAQFDNDAHRPDVKIRRHLFKTKWVEDKSLTDASFDELRAHYHKYCEPSVPAGLQHDMFFAVTDDAMLSMLNVKEPLFIAASGHDDDVSPFLIGIQCYRSDDNGDDDAIGAANVQSHDGKCSGPTEYRIAVQALIKKLYPILRDQCMMPAEAAGSLSHTETWFTALPRSSSRRE